MKSRSLWRLSLPVSLATLLALPSLGALAAPNTTWIFELLHSFDGGPVGRAPYAGLVEYTLGVYWGSTSAAGGESGTGRGTVFKFSPGSKPVVVHTFSGRDGASPKAELLSAGRYLYGSTEAGGIGDNGVIFRIAGLGFSVVRHMATGSGTRPDSPLIRGTDGKFYGTAPRGGAFGEGTAFRMDAAGALTVLHHFEGGTVDGAMPGGPLVQHADGALYGTTPQGGDSGYSGTVFKVTPGGAYTLLHRFTRWGDHDTDGCQPAAGLTLTADGNFVGSNSNCGEAFAWAGTLFKMKPDGTVTLWHTFNQGVSGQLPLGELVKHSDGLYYGVTLNWENDEGCGSVFGKSLGGSFATRHVFPADGSQGCAPRGTLLSAQDGALYGTTTHGGVYGHGTIFRLRKVPVVPDH